MRRPTGAAPFWGPRSFGLIPLGAGSGLVGGLEGVFLCLRLVVLRMLLISSLF